MCTSLPIRGEAIIRDAADDVVGPSTVARDKDAIDARVAASGVDAGAMLIEAQVDRDGAGSSLQEVEAGRHLAVGCGRGGGEEREEADKGSDGEGLHDDGVGES